MSYQSVAPNTLTSPCTLSSTAASATATPSRRLKALWQEHGSTDKAAEQQSRSQTLEATSLHLSEHYTFAPQAAEDYPVRLKGADSRS